MEKQSFREEKQGALPPRAFTALLGSRGIRADEAEVPLGEFLWPTAALLPEAEVAARSDLSD